MGRSAATHTASLILKALTDAFISVATFFLAARFGAIFYKRFLSRENVHNQYVTQTSIPPFLSLNLHLTLLKALLFNVSSNGPFPSLSP